MHIAHYGGPFAVACGVLAVAAPAAQAADPGLTCRSSVVRAQVAGGTPIEPLAANRLASRCADDSVGLEDVGAVVAQQLGLDAAFATTAANGAAAPAARRVEARAGAAELLVPGTDSQLRVEGVTSRASAACAGGVASLSATSSVARITLAGEELPTNDVVERVLGGISGSPLGAVLRIVPAEEIRSGSGADASVTRRALHVTVALADRTLADVVVGEASAGTADSACTTTTAAPGGGDGSAGTTEPGRPVAGSSFGGGRAVTLGQLTAFGIPAGHPCRNRRYGRNVALVGTNGRDAVSGSRFADRIFGLRGADRISGSLARDCIDGGGGRDRLSGSLGADCLIGRRARDRVWGGPGNDRVIGGRGRDVVNGESGNDRLFGGRGNDTLNAGFGRDRLYGGRGDDTINAATAGRRQIVDCGPGRDEVRLNYGDRQRRCERVLRLR